jgi:citrate synthase
VDGAAGELILAGFPIEELAARASFEESIYLLWHDALPGREALETFRVALAARRELPQAAVALLRAAAARQAAPIDALLMAAGALRLGAGAEEPRGDALTLVAGLPTLAAAYWRLRNGREPVPPRADLGLAANYLFMLSGERPRDEPARALETYWNTVADHGLNASTFTARIIVSTGSDMISAAAGAIGALKGPLHGGAPAPALDMVFEIGAAERADAYLRAKLERGERLMGFGHRIYKVRDPRADVLAAAAERLYRNGGDMGLYTLAREVEQTALRLLAEYKPGRKLQTNVEFYTALLLHGLGLPPALFTPTFALGRAAGWTAHCFEQQAAGRLIRPQSAYTGARGRRWVPLESRS